MNNDPTMGETLAYAGIVLTALMCWIWLIDVAPGAAFALPGAAGGLYLWRARR